MSDNTAPVKTSRPNVILILADDMGFADLGCTGSEIQTPNIDALAQGGAMLSAMYNCARCCPTRASLLTGLYPHNAGVGHMGANLGTPAYQGFLRNDSATIAEHLRASGYATLMSGKWHVAGDFEARNVDSWRVGDLEHPTPRQRGFDCFYGIMDGATHFFSPHYMLEDDNRIETVPDDFYFTDAITDKAIGMIEGAVEDEKPFFLYLAHTAPHWPLHAHPEDIARYDGIYSKGWDHIRMDQSIGTLIAALKRLGQFDNTLVMFLSDNGGCAEFMAEDGWAKFYPNQTHDGKQITMGNVTGLRPGDAQTFQSYDKPWANVSNAPFGFISITCMREAFRLRWSCIGPTASRRAALPMRPAMLWIFYRLFLRPPAQPARQRWAGMKSSHFEVSPCLGCFRARTGSANNQSFGNMKAMQPSG